MVLALSSIASAAPAAGEFGGEARSIMSRLVEFAAPVKLSSITMSYGRGALLGKYAEPALFFIVCPRTRDPERLGNRNCATSPPKLDVRFRPRSFVSSFRFLACRRELDSLCRLAAHISPESASQSTSHSSVPVFASLKGTASYLRDS